MALTWRWLNLAHANKSHKNTDNTTRLASFALDGYDGSTSITTTLSLNDQGALLAFSGNDVNAQWNAGSASSTSNALLVNWNDAGVGNLAASALDQPLRLAALTHASKSGRASSALESVNAGSGANFSSIPTPGSVTLIAAAGLIALRRRR
ncbi:MAG: hypothetical protein AAGB34_09545 [Planctomycetota bacterium]